MPAFRSAIRAASLPGALPESFTTVVVIVGLPNDACHYRPSLFCEADRVFALTPADRILLRTLYDPRLSAGMAREEALPIVRIIVGELMPSLAEP